MLTIIIYKNYSGVLYSWLDTDDNAEVLSLFPSYSWGDRLELLKLPICQDAKVGGRPNIWSKVFLFVFYFENLITDLWESQYSG